TLPTSVRSWNPRFMDKLYATTNPIGVLSELLLGLLNGNCHVFHVSPVLSLIEMTTVRELGKLFGYQADRCGGITNPGGAMSNLVATVTARNIQFPHLKEQGLAGGPRLTLFVSEQSHYSFIKAAFATGIGSRQVISVPCDTKGRMRVDLLDGLVRASLDRGEQPFMVVATAGTTVLGAFDPIEAIATLAQTYNLWLHVDASWGGNLIFSRKRGPALLRGTYQADSITINPHKMLGVPLQCSFLLTREARALAQSNTAEAHYLFHEPDGDQDANDYPVDLGESSLGCGRRPDALKMFLAWKYYGTDGFEARLDRALTNAQYLTGQLRKRSAQFRLVVEDPASLNVCFWYIPLAVRYDQLELTDPTEFRRRLGEATRSIHRQLRQDGQIMIDYSPLMVDSVQLPDFFRAVVNPPNLTVVDLDFIVDEIERIGAMLDA
ncbi:pyridoxal phosphate-dependent transferase, partial [Dimargaris cristalligena]